MATSYPYVKQVALSATRHGVPYGVLLGLLLHEDATGATGAVSPTGDYGPAQINLASHPGVTQKQAQSPAFSIDWAARYLRSLYDRCGTWAGALTQYNHGAALGCNSSTYSKAVLDLAAKHGYRGAAQGNGGATGGPLTVHADMWPYVLAAFGAVVVLALILR